MKNQIILIIVLIGILLQQESIVQTKKMKLILKT